MSRSLRFTELPPSVIKMHTADNTWARDIAPPDRGSGDIPSGRRPFLEGQAGNFLIRQFTNLSIEEDYFFQNMDGRTKTESLFLLAGAYDVTSSRSPTPRIGTFSLRSCLGMSIHDPDKKVAGVLHAFFPGLQEFCAAEMKWMRSMFSDMVDSADEAGGASYKLTTFNLESGLRDPELTALLIRGIENISTAAEFRGRIISLEHRNERNFIIDSRDGSIFSGRPAP